MTHKITTTWKEDMLFESDNPSGNSFLIDTKTEKHPEQRGMSPKAMMLSSLAGCSGLDIVSLLEKMKVEDYTFKMDVEAEMTEEHPKHYHTVTVDYHFYGNDLNEKKINKAVKLSVDKYCGVMEMFRQFAKIITNVHIHPKQ